MMKDSVKVKGTDVRLIKADITTLKADAIVNAANNRLEMGGGVAGAIRRKGGTAIEDEAMKKGPIAIGESIATAAGSLPAKYVIHAATMGMDFRTDEKKIRDAMASALAAADELKLQSVAFPALGCGVGGFPLKPCAKIMAQETFRRIFDIGTGLKEIIFCLHDDAAYEAFKQHALGYLDYIAHQLKSPFVTVDAIIETASGIVIIERSNPPFGWAIPGGFVDYGESLEDAVKREAKEETGLDITDVHQMHTYSVPGRDPRFQTVTTVFTATATGTPQAGDDAAAIRVITPREIDTIDFAFDHKQVLKDYLAYKSGVNSLDARFRGHDEGRN
jgi:O-acetyl-ADP-ribose deacetylase (regulator of RNase III)/ADP-ribose pyrophosphatase YjhB (NUDIX family)